MTTGKIEYAPDYKSHAQKTADRYRSFFEVTKMNVVDSPEPRSNNADAERLRLERDLINAALAKRKAEKIYHEGKEVGYSTLNAYVDADLKLAEVTDRLIEFEESLKNK